MKLKTLIERNGKHYLVSTVKLASWATFSPDHAYETMVFAADNEGKVTDWMDLYCDRAASEVEAQSNHDRAVTTFNPER